MTVFRNLTGLTVTAYDDDLAVVRMIPPDGPPAVLAPADERRTLMGGVTVVRRPAGRIIGLSDQVDDVLDIVTRDVADAVRVQIPGRVVLTLPPPGLDWVFRPSNAQGVLHLEMVVGGDL